MEEKFVITRLDQLKAMADPLRVRLLELVVAKERTIADLGALLREPISKLYHHVDLLRNAGLIEIVGRRQKRGTEERWFRAVAKDYTVDDAMFLFGKEAEQGPEALIALSNSIFEGLRGQAMEAIRSGRIDSRRPGRKLFLETLDLRLTETEFADLCTTLDQWIDSAKQRSGGSGRKGGYRFGVGFFPVAAAALGIALLVRPPLAAQEPRARAAEVITEQDVRHKIDLIAHDSMLGRNTPSRELDLTAAYVASVFRQAGLRPLGKSFFQPYPLVRRRLIAERSSMTVTEPGGRAVKLQLGPTLAFSQGVISDQPREGPVVVVGGTPDPSGIVADSIRNRVVVWVVDVTGPQAAALDGVAGALIGAGPAAMVVIPNAPQMVAQAAAVQSNERVAPEGASASGLMLLAADQAAVAQASPVLDSLFHRARTSQRVELLGTALRATIALVDSTVGHTRAPNVVGVVRGSDPVLARQYVAISAHMDHLGVQHGAPGDSIYNGADDNGSGTVGVLEIARAMGRAGVRPKRSILFAIVSGEEKGLWGSEYLVGHSPVPIDSIVADINLDMIGRNWRDTVGVIGREHSNLGEVLDRVAARHPELRVTPVGDRWPDQNRFYRSDHYNFARAGVPILFLSSGYAPEYHEVGDSPDKIDAEKLARLARLVFYFGLEVADQADRPRWNPERRAKIVAKP